MTHAQSDAPVHPELASEQRLVDHAYACLERMRDRATYLKSLGYLGGNVHADSGLTPETRGYWDRDKQRRIDDLADPDSALCFGRIDEALPHEALPHEALPHEALPHEALPHEALPAGTLTEGGSPQEPARRRHYIGRRHVEDDAGGTVVTDWRAPVAVPFYRATVADPMGLLRRRRFLAEGRKVADLIDEDMEHPGETGAGAYVPDPLLAEITRARTGEMRDIVATIQSEQDVIIRAPLDHCLVVQGGPGTGKTAVGLHRAAFLLYSHREALERQRLLIVGPNRIFLRYISQVLPSLGESSAAQLTLEGLAGARFRLGEVEAPEVARLKGDARMAEVVRRAVLDRVRPPSEDLTVRTRFGEVTIGAAEMAALVRTTQSRSRAGDARPHGLPANRARSGLRAQVVSLAWKRHREKGSSDPAFRDAFEADVRSSSPLQAALDRAWPALTPAGVLRRLYGNPGALSRSAGGVLAAEERGLLARRPAARASEQRWTRADLALLDEAGALLDGFPGGYGHIIVDEAQDLSAMELRMIARRSRQGSMTLLGDLAQATASGGQQDWADASAHLGAHDVARGETSRICPEVVELTVGYRVPGPIMDFANRLLGEAAPGLKPHRSVRELGLPPLVARVPPAGLADAAAAETRRLAALYQSVAVVAPDPFLESAAAAMGRAGVAFADGRRTAALGERVTLLSPLQTKGLELDAVLVVEPALVHAGTKEGARLLYVVLTRAVQELSILHAAPLPSALAAHERG